MGRCNEAFKNGLPQVLFNQSPMSTYCVEVDQLTKILGATEQRAVVSSELLPGSMEVIGHYIDEVQFPGDREKEKVFLKTFEKLPLFFQELFQGADSLCNLSNLISSINGSFSSSHCSS